jgi:hypothetical protein
LTALGRDFAFGRDFDCAFAFEPFAFGRFAALLSDDFSVFARVTRVPPFFFAAFFFSGIVFRRFPAEGSSAARAVHRTFFRDGVVECAPTLTSGFKVLVAAFDAKPVVRIVSAEFPANGTPLRDY